MSRRRRLQINAKKYSKCLPEYGRATASTSPQAPAPHPYFKENSDSKAVTKESHKPTENENEIKQDETNPEDQKLYPEKNSETIGVEQTSTTSTNYTFGADHMAATKPDRDAAATTNNILDDPQIRMKIELRKSQEEFESQQRATARISV